MHRHVLPLVLLAILALLPAHAHADGEGDGEAREPNVTFAFDLTGVWTTPAVRGPNLATPADLVTHGSPETWNQDPGDERRPWLPFDDGEEDHEPLALPAETFCELFQVTAGVLARVFEEGGARIEAFGTSANFTVPASLEGAVRAHAAWCLATFSPTIVVDAVLERVGPTPAVRAAGRVVVHAGRWTRVAFLKEELPCVVGNHVEIAQDAVVLNPYIQNLVEGHEIYVRFHAGESRNLVELWAGDLEHVRTTTIGVDALQGPLRTSEPSALSLPTTRVMRVASALVVPTGAAVERTVEWTRGDVVQRLTLRVRGPGPGMAAPGAAEDAPPLAAARLGALYTPLEHGARPAGADIEERAQQLLRQVVSEGADREPEVWGGTRAIKILVAPREVLERARALLVAHETALRGVAATVELLAVPEETWRAEGGPRLLMPGEVLPPARRQALKAGGAVLLASTRLHVVEGVAAGLRIGESVPGLIDIDTEVAQEAAGLVVTPWALFDGLFGSLTVRAIEGGWSLSMGGGVAWADPAAGQLSMTRATDGRTTMLPLLSGGGGDLGGITRFARNAPGPSIVSVIVRGAEVLLVVVDLRAPE